MTIPAGPARRRLRRMAALFCLLALLTARAGAQTPIGARSAGLGGMAAVDGERWALFGNAAAGDTARPSLSLFAMRWYGLPELTDVAAAFGLPTGVGRFSAGFHRFGDSRYREQRFRLGWSGGAGGLRFGVTAGWHHVALGGGYGSAGAAAVDLGLVARLTGRLRMGVRAFNVNGGGWKTAAGGREELPRLMGVGLAWRLSPGSRIACEWNKELDRLPVLRAGLEVVPLPGLSLRAGLGGRPLSLSGGLSLEGRSVGLGVAVQRHPDPLLGYSPGLELTLYL